MLFSLLHDDERQLSIVMYKYCDSQNTNILGICTLMVLLISLVIMLPSGKCYLPAQETIYANGIIIVTEYSVLYNTMYLLGFCLRKDI